MKNKTKKQILKKLLTQAEEAWKSAVKRRDKGLCQVHGKECKEPIKQADHFRTRRHGWTFLMVENGTYVCRTLNWQKSRGENNAAEKIGFAVLEREGVAMVQYLLETGRQPKKWTEEELKEKIKELNGAFL